MTRPALSRRDWTVIAGVNGVWLSGYSAWLTYWPLPMQVAIVAAALCLAPGAAWDWVWPRRSRALGAAIARMFPASILVLVIALVTFRLLAVVPGQDTVWIAMAALSNAGLLAAWARRRAIAWPRTLTRVESTLAFLVLAGVMAMTFVTATRVVPPLVDHDLEMQGTGYALATRLEPRFLTDRGLRYYFAHPPLLHLYVAGSFLYQGHLDALQVYDTTSLAQIETAFARAPMLVDTRTPNIMFAGMTAALLLLWTFRRSRRWWLSALVVLAYLSGPEVLVRSAYGGYFALSTLAALLMVLSVRTGGRSSAAALSLWAIWVNHKLIVVVAGVVLGCVAAARDLRTGLRQSAALLAGAVAGTALFWTYGLVIAPGDFVTDHLGHHLWQRLTHANPLGYGGYPAAIALWREFITHTGIILLPAGLAFGAWDLSRSLHRTNGHARESWMLLCGIVLAALIFSVVDWRMTKHLMPMALALHMLLVPARQAPPWRVYAAGAACLWLIAWNVPVVAGLAHDFGAFTVTPAW